MGFGLQSIGLETTTASRSAFLLYLNVKFVPFLAALIYQRSISYVTWISALLALAGTALLSTDGGWPNIGDSWCVGAALASAFYILRLETHAKLNDAAGLNAVAFLTGKVKIKYFNVYSIKFNIARTSCSDRPLWAMGWRRLYQRQIGTKCCFGEHPYTGALLSNSPRRLISS